MFNKLDDLKARIQYCEGSMDIIGITEINPKNCRYYPGKLDALKDLIRNIAQPNKEHSHVLIMGDFNYNKIDWNQWTSENDREGKRSWNVLDIVI